ncbi:hypothetical protein ACFL3I_06710 [Pseudomonadota bacterium]
MFKKILLYITPISFFLFSGCDKQGDNQPANVNSAPVSMERTGWLASEKLREASGMQASFSRDGDFFLHNDEGKPYIYAINGTGANLGRVSIVPAKNKDWEDITSVPVDDGRWIVAGDIGDNQAKRKFIKLYFAGEPEREDDDHYHGKLELKHWLELTYPDGPRDCESMAYDPIGKQILLLSKRDKPPRLYAVDLETALTQESAELKFLGKTSTLRPPTPADRARFGGRTDFISQPTGFDISADGSEAVIITYRSLYRYQRKQDEDWLSALQKQPAEVVGPPAVQNEAIAYSPDGKSIYVTTEKQPAPVYRFQFK